MPILLHIAILFYFRSEKQHTYFKRIWQNSINFDFSNMILSSRKKSDKVDFALGHDYIIDENLEYEESELRLIIYQIAIGISLNLIILAIFISIPILTMKFIPRVVMPKVTNQNQFGIYKMRNIYKHG